MHADNVVKVLFFGDLVGIPGRALMRSHLGALKAKYKADLIIVNGENAAKNGRGLTPRVAEQLYQDGVDCITTGNHVFQKKELFDFLSSSKNIVRPLNYPTGCPGTGCAFIPIPGLGKPLAVLNLQGRVFMRELLLCPFKTLETVLTFVSTKTNCIFVDFHAEASSEKVGLGLYFDGRVSCIAGTHTHIQTADNRILANGTAYITDAGMCGALNGMLGMKKEPILSMMLSQMPHKFVVEVEPPFCINGICVTIDSSSGQACSIERIHEVFDNVSFDERDFPE
jgi:metallophosphoesterase (TIGR00282 family)